MLNSSNKSTFKPVGDPNKLINIKIFDTIGVGESNLGSLKGVFNSSN